MNKKRKEEKKAAATRKQKTTIYKQKKTKQNEKKIKTEQKKETNIWKASGCSGVGAGGRRRNDILEPEQFFTQKYHGSVPCLVCQCVCVRACARVCVYVGVCVRARAVGPVNDG